MPKYREDNRTAEQKTESALRNYKFLTESDYSKGLPIDMEQMEGERDFLYSYLFDIIDHFGLPFTNNYAYYPDTIDIGEFLGYIGKALEMSGWVSPHDHQRALQEVRRSVR